MQNFGPRPFNNFGRSNGDLGRGYSGQYGGFPRGYEYQGNIAYQDPVSTDFISPSYGFHNPSSNNHSAFNCYNYMNNTPSFSQHFAALVTPSLDAVEDPS